MKAQATHELLSHSHHGRYRGSAFIVCLETEKARRARSEARRRAAQQNGEDTPDDERYA